MRMLRLEIQLSPEGWDDEKQEFVDPEVQVIQLEHSLVSLSKWESKWHKPFLSQTEKSFEETVDYIRCMTITQNVNPDVYRFLSNKDIETVNQYISDSMTATWFTDNGKTKKSRNGEQVTAEIIYYWMTAFNIPFECQKWHLNRLLTFIEVCERKSNGSNKMSKKETMGLHKALNNARRKPR